MPDRCPRTSESIDLYGETIFTRCTKFKGHRGSHAYELDLTHQQSTKRHSTKTDNTHTMARKPQKPNQPIDRSFSDAELKALLDQMNEHASSQDYEEQGDDVVGYWVPELTPIHCRPKGAKLFDGNIDKAKPSILIITELLLPCAIAVRDESRNWRIEIAKPGSLVGVWGKPGLRKIRYTCDLDVWIRPDGEREIGKPNPMKLFSVTAPKGSEKKLIPVVDDARDKSLEVLTWLDTAKPQAGNKTKTAASHQRMKDSDDEIEDDDAEEQTDDIEEIDARAGL